MDANSLRYVLIAIAGSIAVSVNVPWSHTARSLARCLTALTAPSHPGDARSSWRAARQPLGHLPWPDIARGRAEVFAVVPVAGTRRYAVSKARIPR